MRLSETKLGNLNKLLWWMIIQKRFFYTSWDIKDIICKVSNLVINHKQNNISKKSDMIRFWTEMFWQKVLHPHKKSQNTYRTENKITLNMQNNFKFGERKKLFCCNQLYVVGKNYFR